MAEQRKQNDSEIRPGQAGNLSPDDETTTSDLENDSDLERVELLAAGAGDEEDIDEDDVGEKLNELAASTEEEVDALRVNLLQDDELASTRDGSGRVVDETAEDQLARFTEADSQRGDFGGESVEPGRDDTSRILREHHRNTSIARSDAIIEGKLDEPRDEEVPGRQVDEGTAG